MQLSAGVHRRPPHRTTPPLTSSLFSIVNVDVAAAQILPAIELSIKSAYAYIFAHTRSHMRTHTCTQNCQYFSEIQFLHVNSSSRTLLLSSPLLLTHCWHRCMWKLYVHATNNAIVRALVHCWFRIAQRQSVGHIESGILDKLLAFTYKLICSYVSREVRAFSCHCMQLLEFEFWLTHNKITYAHVCFAPSGTWWLNQFADFGRIWI